MMKTQSIALLTALTYTRAVTQVGDNSGRSAVIHYERCVVFVPHGVEPEVRDLRDAEREAFTEMVAANGVEFMPAKCVEFERCFMFAGQEGEPMRPMMFGTGFGIYVEGDGQPTATKDVRDITYRLAATLLGVNGEPYTGLEIGQADLTLKELRFCFAQTMEVVQSVVAGKAREMAQRQSIERDAFARNLSETLAKEYIGEVFGEDFSYLFKDEPEPEKANA